MKKLATLLLSSLSILTLVFSLGCNKSSSDTTLDAVETYAVFSAVSATTAQAYTVVGAYGDATVTADGVCWSSTNQTPTIANSKTTNTIDTIAFASNLTGLTANTTYYVRGYITNGAGTAYSDVVSFKTRTATFATTATISTFTGNGTAGFVNGPPAITQFYNPKGICTDAAGNMYVADAYNNVIRKITAAGVTSTYAGSGTLGYVDGTATTAQFYAPNAVAADAAGNIYVADLGNNVIRKITPSGVVSTLAGKGYAGYADGTGVAAVFKSPSGLVADAAGNIYVADKGNNAIRKITPAGVVTTFAGNGTASQIDATGTTATFNAPSAIAIDSQGNLYVTDQGNYAIRKITTAAAVTALVGNLYTKTVVASPSGICLDAAGNIYITDANGRILEISNGNILFSLAGTTGVTGFTNGTNTSAVFNGPQAITADSQGNLYIVDYYNNVIRKMTVTTTP